MNYESDYWFYPKAFSNDFCDKIINIAKKQKQLLAITNREEKQIASGKKIKTSDLKKRRNSNVVWLEDQFIYDEVYPILHQANLEAKWNIDFDWSEACQFTKYSKGQFYDWHCDSGPIPYSKDKGDSWHGKVRKLSCTISLSEPKDYKGGLLEFDIRNSFTKSKKMKCKEILPKGSICVFPSYTWHRVTPVTKGTRYSLVIWNLGKPFR